MNKILRVFLNADLRSGHDGLSALAKKSAIDVQTISNGEFLIFINTGRNKLKMFAANNVIAYLKLKNNERINMATIQKLPTVFNGGKIHYETALRDVIEKELEKRSTNLKVI